MGEKPGWKKFHKLSVSGKKFSRRAAKVELTTTRHAHRFVVTKLSSLRNVKEHIVLWLVLIGVIISAVAAQMYVDRAMYRTADWSDGGTYAEGVLGPINTLNPLYASTNAELSVSKLIFSSLYSYDETGSLSDDLAKKLVVSNSGRTYTVTLRDDAQWSDGKKLTSADVLFTVDLMKSPDARAIMQASWLSISAEAPDENTVIFTLPSSYASFKHALTFSVLPKHILEGVDQGSLRQHSFSVKPVGSGPFQVRLLQDSPGATQKIANLTSSPHYYKGKPKLSRFELHAYETNDALTEAIQIGSVSAAADLETNLQSIPSQYTVHHYPINSGVYALYNNSSSILRDKQVREALRLATDTVSLRKMVGAEAPAIASPFVEGQLAGQKLPEATTYNPQAAQNILKKAGWVAPKEGETRVKKKQPLQLRVVTVKNPVYEKVLEKIAGQWRNVGVDVVTEVQDPDDPTQDFVQTVLQPRNFDVLLYELMIGADPDVYAYWHSSQANQTGFNFANYKSEAADDYLSSARGTLNQALRNEKYKRFAKQWSDDIPAIGLYQSTMTYVYRPSVRPIIPERGLPGVSDRYSNVLYWAAQQDSVYKTP